METSPHLGHAWRQAPPADVTAAVGVPGGLTIADASRLDRQLVKPTIISLPVAHLPLTAATPQGMGREKGDAYDAGRAIVQDFGFTAHIRAREEEAQALTQAAWGPGTAGG